MREMINNALLKRLRLSFNVARVFSFEERISMCIIFQVGLRLDIANVQQGIEQILRAIFLHFEIHNVLLLDEIVHDFDGAIF